MSHVVYIVDVAVAGRRVLASYKWNQSFGALSLVYLSGCLLVGGDIRRITGDVLGRLSEVVTGVKRDPIAEVKGRSVTPNGMACSTLRY